MELIRIEDNEIFKMLCPNCKGTGVYKGKNERGDLAIVCKECNGKGYKLVSGKDGVFYRNVETNEVYMSTDNEIYGENIRFEELVHKDGVGHVIYESNLDSDEDYLHEHGYGVLQVLPYGIFYRRHVLPLPIKEFNCPRRLEETYDSNPSFDNGCPDGKKSDCKNFGCEECWNQYYKNAKTYTKKQNKLRGMNGNNSR